MKKSFILNSLLVVSLVAPSAAFSQSVGAIKPNPPATVKTEAKARATVNNIENDVAEALTIIQDNYVDGKKVDYNELFKSSIESMLHSLDPHSNYFDAKEREAFLTEQQSQYFGIGAVIGTNVEPNGETWTHIRATFENAPANRGGLRYGDKIIEVNGVSMKNKANGEVRTHLIGPRGTTAKITVVSNITKQPRTIEIVRDAVSQPSIPEAYMVRPGVAFIAMTGGFNQTTAGEFREAWRNLKAQGAEKLIIDLRNNGGGLVTQANQVANTFLQDGQTILTQRGRAEGSRDYAADNSRPENVPLVLLVNGGSASASEILAGALQDHDRALIVGEQTFGKGLVQMPMPLPYGSMLLLTIAKYQTPSGRTIQRDYSNGNLYDYYTNGGTLRDPKAEVKPTGEAVKTDTGRTVYGGGGIAPDEVVKPATITASQARLQVPVFGFALDLAAGKVAGFENFKIDRPIDFDGNLKATDFPVTNELFAAFKKSALANKENRLTAAQIDKERVYFERQLRFELATAAYGSTTATQVFYAADPQISRAVELFPKAEKLAQAAALARAAKAEN